MYYNAFTDDSINTNKYTYIRQACFGLSPIIIINLLYVTNNSNGVDSYFIRLLNTSYGQPNKEVIFVNVNESIKKMKSDLTQNRFYLYFTNILVIYDYSIIMGGFVSFGPHYVNFSHSGNDTNYMDMNVYPNNLLVYSTTNIITYYNVSTRSPIKNLTFPLISCFARSPPYLFVLSNNTVIQYDETTNTIISVYNTTPLYYQCCQNNWKW